MGKTGLFGPESHHSPTTSGTDLPSAQTDLTPKAKREAFKLDGRLVNTNSGGFKAGGRYVYVTPARVSCIAWPGGARAEAMAV